MKKNWWTFPSFWVKTYVNSENLLDSLKHSFLNA